MLEQQLNPEKTLSRRILLRAILKMLTSIAVICLSYIFIASFFDDAETPKTGQHTFDIAALTDNSAVYFKLNRRELLVIKTQGRYKVFWANDPIYGCRLEFLNSIIKPVCIDIEYALSGYNAGKDQQLLAPEYEINGQDKLIVYLR